jgi:hypothetical protein
VGLFLVRISGFGSGGFQGVTGVRTTTLRAATAT